jgi:hypothetical protein
MTGYLCPVCGYPHLFEMPWSDGAASDEICPSCGTHFGYEDVAGGDAAARQRRYRELRETWEAGGMSWFSQSSEPPPDWDPPSFEVGED